MNELTVNSLVNAVCFAYIYSFNSFSRYPPSAFMSSLNQLYPDILSRSMFHVIQIWKCKF